MLGDMVDNSVTEIQSTQQKNRKRTSGVWDNVLDVEQIDRKLTRAKCK